MRPECATHFGSLHSEIDNLKEDVREHRADYKELTAKIDLNREAVTGMFTTLRDDVVGLKVKARGWGAVGGLFAALVSIGIAVAVMAFK
jgi:hypothetical protein